jgi:hypothetical protein
MAPRDPLISIDCFIKTGPNATCYRVNDTADIVQDLALNTEYQTPTSSNRLICANGQYTGDAISGAT